MCCTFLEADETPEGVCTGRVVGAAIWVVGASAIFSVIGRTELFQSGVRIKTARQRPKMIIKASGRRRF
jgi:hypothetical protein